MDFTDRLLDEIQRILAVAALVGNRLIQLGLCRLKRVQGVDHVRLPCDRDAGEQRTARNAGQKEADECEFRTNARAHDESLRMQCA